MEDGFHGHCLKVSLKVFSTHARRRGLVLRVEPTEDQSIAFMVGTLAPQTAYDNIGSWSPPHVSVLTKPRGYRLAMSMRMVASIKTIPQGGLSFSYWPVVRSGQTEHVVHRNRHMIVKTGTG